MIKDELLSPFVELNTEYYDLGLPHRDETNDQVTFEAGEAIKKYKVGVKCATITPNAQRVEEYKLKEMWKSPNGTIRAILDGRCSAPRCWSATSPGGQNLEKAHHHRPSRLRRCVQGHRAARARSGKAELLFTAQDGTETRQTIYDFECGGVLQGLYNKDTSIRSFAHSCFQYALDTKQDLWFATKDTISKQYDQTFKLIFAEIFENEYKEKFDQAGIEYFYTLIDDAVARVIRSEGGYIWACKNYDGDVMSDMVSTAFSSLAMMTSVLVSPDGNYEYEAAHGTVTRHYYRHLKGEVTSTNPIATIFAWTGALRKRGELDGNQPLMTFADQLESACLETIEAGKMTKDLAGLCEGMTPTTLSSAEFIAAIRQTLESKLA